MSDDLTSYSTDKVTPDSLCDRSPFVSLSSLTILEKPIKNTFCFAAYRSPESTLTLAASSDYGNVLPIALKCEINSNVSCAVMIDSGATTQFIDEDFAKSKNIPLIKKPFGETLTVFDGRESSAGLITHEAEVSLLIDNHLEICTFQVTKLAQYQLIVGKSWLKKHNPSIDWVTNNVTFDSQFCKDNCLRDSSSKLLLGAGVKQEAEKELEKLLAKQGIDEIPEPELLRKMIPPEFHDFLPLFSKLEAEKLPPHRYIDHEIKLLPGTKPPFGPMYEMSDAEQKMLKIWIDDNLRKGFIRSSSSSAASPVLFVKKPGGGLRLCVDYRALNAITQKNRYPLPLINESLRHVRGAKIFSRLDLRAGFNLIRIKPGDEWKTAFRTRYGLFEYLVMPFGLTNAPASCQQFVNDTLREYLDIFCVCYVDDILIYSKTREEHIEHVRKVLTKLAEVDLFIKGEKCDFFVTKTNFLGFIISEDGVSMDPKKVAAVREWPTPKNVKDVQSFLGFANFYRRFIENYAKKCSKLFNLTRKDAKFNWTDEHQKIFEDLKEAFCTGPILRHFDPALDTVVDCDASDSVVSGILSQQYPDPQKEGKFILHPVAYFSKKMTPAQCNYGIGDKELLAIILCFEEWRPYLYGVQQPVLVLTDHNNLASFMQKKLLNRRQARWALQLAEYNFKIVYRPGAQNRKADALTRRSGDLPKEGDGRGRPTDAILQKHNFDETFDLSTLSLASITVEIKDLIKTSLKSDTLGQEIMKCLATGAKKHPKVALSECSIDNDMLHVYGLVYVPQDESLHTEIIRSSHDTPAAGHPGKAATYELVTRNFWWPNMRNTIDRYVRNCHTCTRIKPVRHAPYGFLKPLQVPQKRWDSLSMDFIVKLPNSEGFDAIYVVVDRLTKMAHFIATTSDVDAEGTARLFRDNVFRLHGLPRSIVSDRGTQFVNSFMRDLCKLLQIKQNLSTAYHPETDGQTERINQVLEQYLRGYCNYMQDDWIDWLSMAEFAYNNTISAGIGNITPFFANYGYHPRFDLYPADNVTLDKAVTDVQQTLTQLEAFLKAEMKWSQARYAEQTNKHRTSPPVYNVGDSVWLLRRNIKTTRPSDKLDFKKIGPFEILERVGTHAYKLKISPRHGKIHPVFHINLLEPAATDPLKGQRNPPPPPLVIDDEEEFFVDEILDSKRKNRKVLYLVHWKGYSIDETTWEPLSNLHKVLPLVYKFHEAYPNKPRSKKLPPLPEESDTESDS